MSRTQKSTYCTTREAAQILGVSVRTAQVWAENGLLEAWKTSGGHRRISRNSVHRLIYDDSDPHSARQAGSNGHRVPRKFLKTIIIEHDPELLRAYVDDITTWKLPTETITINNGIDGLIAIGRNPPDLLITSLCLPDVDGLMLVRKLLDSSYRKHMEIIVVSELSSAQIEALGGLPEGITLLPRPLPFPQLREAFTRLLERGLSGI